MITFEPYQKRAIEASHKYMRNKKGVLVAPAGAGKTLICAGIVAFRLDLNPRVLWLTPTQETKTQGEEACRKIGVQDRVDCACFQGSPSAAGYDMLIIDEAHTAACDSIRGIIATAGLDCWILGVTATPDRPDGEDITKIIGPIFHTVSRADVMATGRIVSASVRWMDVKGDLHDEVQKLMEEKKNTKKEKGLRKRMFYGKAKSTGIMKLFDWKNSPEAKELWKEINEKRDREILYQSATKIGIVENQARNEKAAKVARRAIDAGRSVLVLVAEKAQGRAIVDLIGEGAVMVHSGMKKREATIEALRAGEIRGAVATSLADVGLDVPIISVLVMACGGRAAGRTEQRVGRAMRNNGDGLDKWVFDYRDGQHFFLSAQAKARAKVYKTLGLKEA